MSCISEIRLGKVELDLFVDRVKCREIVDAFRFAVERDLHALFQLLFGAAGIVEVVDRQLERFDRAAVIGRIGIRHAVEVRDNDAEPFPFDEVDGLIAAFDGCYRMSKLGKLTRQKARQIVVIVNN